jgi:hypothetical protein
VCSSLFLFAIQQAESPQQLAQGGSLTQLDTDLRTEGATEGATAGTTTEVTAEAAAVVEGSTDEVRKD